MLFTEYLAARFARRASPIRMSKAGVADLVRRLGLRYADTYRVWTEPAEITDKDLPDSFVIKPTTFWSTHGVMLLRRDGTRYWESLKRRIHTLDSIRVEQERWKTKRARISATDYKIIAEERLIDEAMAEIPLDYKVFVFSGSIEFVLQVDRNHKPGQLSFFDGEFKPLDLAGHIEPKLGEKVRYGTPRLPSCASEILEASRKLSIELRTPFISVDTYATTKGAYVGELTPTPGGPHFGMYRFTPDFDRRLGEAWQAAIGRCAPAFQPASRTFQ